MVKTDQTLSEMSLKDLELYCEAIHDDKDLPERTKKRQIMRCFREAWRRAND